MDLKGLINRSRIVLVAVIMVGITAVPHSANAQGGGAGPSTPQATSTHIQTIQCGTGGFLGAATDEIYSYEEDQAGYWAPGLSNLSLLGNKSIYRDNVLVYSGSPNGSGNSTVAITQPGGAHWSIGDVGGSHVYRIDTYYSDAYQYNGDFNTLQATNPNAANNVPHGPHTFRGNDFTFGGCSSGGSTPPVEVCGDGIDNNGNGQVDEGCPVSPAQSITLSGQAACNGTTPENQLSWIASGGLSIWSLSRDGASIAFVPSGSSYVDANPPAGSHTYTATGVTSAFGFVDSNPVSITTKTCSTAGGISVDITGPDSLHRNSQYQYTASVRDSSTGTIIPINGSSISASFGPTISFDDQGAGNIAETAYQSQGLLIDSPGYPSQGLAAASGGTLFVPSSSSCPGLRAPSSPNALVARQGSFAPLELKFINQQVVDRVSFDLQYGGTETIVVKTIDTDGKLISSSNFSQQGSGSCTSTVYNVSVSLDKGSTTGIAKIELDRVIPVYSSNGVTHTTDGYGIDNLKFTAVHTASSGATLNWSLVNNRIGSLSSVSDNPTTLRTGDVCAQTDAISVTATVNRNGQNQTATASLPVAVNDPCARPPVAVNDQASTVSLVPVTVHVLSNDSDPDGDLDPSSLSITTQPAHGTVSLTGDHKVKYASAASFTGTDTFTYRVCDSGSRCASATAQIVVGSNNAPTGVSYQWQLIPKGASAAGATQFGSLVSNPAFNPVQFAAGANCLLLQDFGPITLRVNVAGTLGGQPAAGTATKLLSAADLCSTSNGNVIGDIFGQNGVSGISVGRNSVVTSNREVKVEGNSQNYKIENYTPKAQLAWGAIQQAASDTTNRLLKEKARKLSDGNYTMVQGDIFNLNPKQGDNPHAADIDTSNPDGGVWYVNGDLHLLGGVQFRGKGTIIVKGQVIISGSVTYVTPSTDLLGLIVLGPDTASPAVSIQGTPPGSSIVGGIFAPNGTIQFKAPLSSGQGLFVGDKMTFETALTGFSIAYDQRITTSPPPGFAQSFVPSLGEAAP